MTWIHWLYTGMACGAGLPVLAFFVTASYILVMFVFSRLTGRIVRRAFSVHDVTPQDDASSGAGMHSIRLADLRAVTSVRRISR